MRLGRVMARGTKALFAGKSSMTFSVIGVTTDPNRGSQSETVLSTVTARAFQESPRADENRGIPVGTRLLYVEGKNVDRHRVTLGSETFTLGEHLASEGLDPGGVRLYYCYNLGTGGG